VGIPNLPDYIKGCTDHGCIIRKPKLGGMGTNGGCRCANHNGNRYIQYLEMKINELQAELKELKRAPKVS
jgi:hypothetical protein